MYVSENSDQGTSNNFNQHKCKGIIIMRSSKDRTIEKKRRHKATTSRRTEQSRARRISNKHKRQEIRDIDPSLKVFIMNEKIYDVHGTQLKVVDGKIKPVLVKRKRKAKENGKIKPVLINGVYKLDNNDDDIVIDKIKNENKSALERLTDKFRKKQL